MKKTVYLLQQTPMWHFQAREKYATLRATELKPKLDRFLIEWWRRKTGADLMSKREWLIDDSHPAFDYKVKIISKGHTTRSMTDPNKKNNDTLFFGNMGCPTKGKEPFLLVNEESGGITLEIMTFHKGLMQLIDDALPTFFLVTNFGTRQDKGFGSFAVKEHMDDSEKLLIDWYGDRCFYMINYKTELVSKNTAKIFRDIDTIYKVLKSGIRSGINHQPDYYIRSYLTRYFLNKHIGGEKRFIKVNEIGPIKGNHKHEHETTEAIPDGNYRYIRALLGATDKEKWDKSSFTINFKHVEGNNHKVIDRIPSPIVFKPVGNCLFILVNDIPEEIYGEEYELSSTMGRDRIKIPTHNEFDMDDMMKGFMNDINSPETRRELKKMKPMPDFVARGIKMRMCRGGKD